jgi:acyl-CoA hydrolase/GNAT superfamily N-acetyltransferase
MYGPADVKAMYQSRVTTAAEAVAGLRSGWRVLVGSGCACPNTLIEAMVARSSELSDVEVVHLLTFGRADYVEPQYAGSFRHNAFFIGPNTRKAVQAGLADYTPIFLSEIPELIRKGDRRCDAVLLHLSPPDKHGYCSMGIHVDIQQAAVESAKLVIAQINPRMPRTFGDTLIHVSKIHHIVEVDTALIELPQAEEPDDTSILIGSHVARLITNGSTLQLGIGSIPNAVLRMLDDKRDLGIHTEMFSDGLLQLMASGAVTNAQKKVHTGKTVTSFTMGSQKLYDFVDDNPSVVFYASDYVNDPRVISRNDKVVAVNSAIQVDLTGQVSSDSIGYRFFSGIGGQVDFIRGAAMSRGGKPIIALPSTAKDGAVSRIVAHLDEGAGVVTSRGDVHYVVTEFGVAYLHGKTIRERALALMSIAHPDFRQELLEYVKERKYVYGDEPIKPEQLYPADQEHFYEFEKERWLVRPLKPTDERRLQEFFYSHKPETVYNRYFAVKKSLGHREATELCCVDYRDRMAFGVFEDRDHGHRIIAVGRYYLDNRRNRAEIAVVVHEERRRRGIARHLISQLREYARRQGITGFYSEVLPTNKPVLEMHRKLGHDVIWSPDEGIYRIQYTLED